MEQEKLNKPNSDAFQSSAQSDVSQRADENISRASENQKIQNNIDEVHWPAGQHLEKQEFEVGQYRTALPFCQEACNLNDGIGCNILGLFYSHGYVVSKDYLQAKTYYEKACKLNNGNGCTKLGFFYSHKQDHQQAKTCYEKGCKLNEGSGCGNLGYLYEIGQGVRQDYKRAKTYYEKACNLHYVLACGSLGDFYKSGRGVKQNFQTAKEYYGKACDLGGAWSLESCDAYKELNEKGY